MRIKLNISPEEACNKIKSLNGKESKIYSLGKTIKSELDVDKFRISKKLGTYELKGSVSKTDYGSTVDFDCRYSRVAMTAFVISAIAIAIVFFLTLKDIYSGKKFSFTDFAIIFAPLFFLTPALFKSEKQLYVNLLKELFTDSTIK